MSMKFTLRVKSEGVIPQRGQTSPNIYTSGFTSTYTNSV